MSISFKLEGPEPVEQYTLFTYICTWCALWLRMALSLDIYYYKFMQVTSTYLAWWLKFNMQFLVWFLLTCGYILYKGLEFTIESWLCFYICLRTPSRLRSLKHRSTSRNLHRKMICRGYRYMARYDRRFLIFTSLQISPAWAMYHHSTSDWLHTVYVRIHPILNKFHIYSYKLSEIRNYIFPREILLYMGLAMLASYCFFVSTFIGIKKFTNYMRFCFHNTKNHKNKNIFSKVRVRVQKKFMNSKIKSKIKNKRFGNRRSVYTNVKRVACLETDSFDGDSTDLGVGATWCVLDNSANSHIWNKESDFVPGSIRALNEMSSVATIGGNNFYPTGTGDLTQEKIPAARGV